MGENPLVQPLHPGSSKAVKLGYIIGTYPELTTTFIDREIRILQELGFQIQVLSIRHPEPFVSLNQDYSEIQKEIIYLLPVNWLRLLLAHLYFAFLHPLAYWGSLAFLLSRPHPGLKLRLKTLLHFAEGVLAAYELKGLPLQHLHAHFIDRAATVTYIAGRFLGLPYSLTAHADEIFEQPLLTTEKIFASSFTITVSEFNKAFILRNNPKIDPAKILVLHPWVNLSQFQPGERPPASPCLHILSVGRLVENKGHRYLIEACARLQERGLDFECQIIGDGPLKADLQALIHRLHLDGRVFLLGGQPQSEVLHRLGWADVFVLASIIAKSGKRDGMPVALAEAMAMQVPVISTNIVGISEMVQPAAGLLVAPENAAALADTLYRMWEAGPAKRQRMGQAGRQIISEQFDLYKGTAQLAELYLQNLKGN